MEFRKVEPKSELRTVETVRDVDRLNEAVAEGGIVIVRVQKRNPELEMHSLLLRHKVLGVYERVPDRIVFRQYGRGVKEYPEAEWELISEVTKYARSSQNEVGWGAYIVPGNAEVGERFQISDLIEDFLATEFWYSKIAAETAEAVWNGEDLIIDHASYKRVLIG